MKTQAISLVGLFLELDRWGLKTLETIPSTAPVALQIVESLAEVRANVFRHLKATQGRTETESETIAAFLACVGDRFTEEAQPMRRLWRKGLIDVRGDRMVAVGGAS